MIREPRKGALAFVTREIIGDDVQLPIGGGLLECLQELDVTGRVSGRGGEGHSLAIPYP